MSETEGEEDVEGDVLREAGADAALAERLAVPSSPRSIFLEEASVYRPVLTGDVFRGVRVPGSSDAEAAYDLTMIVSHPSVMRDGPALAERAQAAPVFPIGGVRRTAWTPDRFDIFPLPFLRDVAASNGFDNVEKRAWAADLRLSGPIETSALDVHKRVACLSPEGVLLLLQRLVHTDTRAAVRLDTLELVFLAKLEEVELLETWTEEYLTAHPPGELFDGLARCAADFNTFLGGTDPESGIEIRGMLGRPLHRTVAERLVWAEIERRA